MSLSGQVVVVTGASRGIGADTAKLLAARGASVVCAARTAGEGDHPLEGSLERTVGEITDAGGTAHAVVVNLARDEDCERLVAETHEVFGPVDVLVNNAAIGFFVPFRELTPSRWTVSWRVTCHAPFVLSQLVLPDMIARGAGRIVNVTSNSAVGPGRSPYGAAPPLHDAAYGAQKALIERLSQGLAEEVYADGVGVVAVAPSQIVPTPGALFNNHGEGRDDPNLEPTSYMPEAILALITLPLADVAGRVVYSQQLLLELGLIEHGAGLGVDPELPVSGFTLR